MFIKKFNNLDRIYKKGTWRNKSYSKLQVGFQLHQQAAPVRQYGKIGELAGMFDITRHGRLFWTPALKWIPFLMHLKNKTELLFPFITRKLDFSLNFYWRIY